MNKDDEITLYRKEISTKVDCLRKLNYEIFDFINPKKCGFDVTGYLYDLTYSLDDAIDKFADLISACDEQAEED